MTALDNVLSSKQQLKSAPLIDKFMDFTDDDDEVKDNLESDSRPASKVKVTDIIKELERRMSQK